MHFAILIENMLTLNKFKISLKTSTMQNYVFFFFFVIPFENKVHNQKYLSKL